MHALFFLYGKYEIVQQLIRDITATKLPIRFCKEGQPDFNYVIDCQLRLLPGGIYDFVFPKEFMEVVLTELNFQDKTRVYDFDFNKSYFGIKPMQLIKRFLKIEDAPDFTPSKEHLFWMKEHVTIVPLGVKYDGEITEPATSPHPGYTHERI